MLNLAVCALIENFGRHTCAPAHTRARIPFTYTFGLCLHTHGLAGREEVQAPVQTYRHSWPLSVDASSWA